RAHHHRADPARPGWRRVASRARGVDPAAQPAALWPRRDSDSVCRHQADRRPTHRATTGVTMLKNQLRPAIVVTLVLILITGIIYPGLVTGVAQLLFPRQANGSLITVNGQVIGSELIAQQFARADYFHPRPSTAGAGYDDTLSGGSNKGPTDSKLADTLIAQAVDSAVRLDGAVKGAVPADLATRSGSGLDPHISPASALLQVARVARARG